MIQDNLERIGILIFLRERRSRINRLNDPGLATIVKLNATRMRDNLKL